MKTSFKNLTSNLLTRKFGGTCFADPYVTGYFYMV